MALSSSAHAATPTGSFARWGRRALFAFLLFYPFVYLSRFNLWVAAPVLAPEFGIGDIGIGALNAALMIGFMAGDLAHGRLSERYGARWWILAGSWGTVACNWLASYTTSATAFGVLWGINGFANAACWSPAIGALAQWWPRRWRGRVFGIAGSAGGVALIVMWIVTGGVTSALGWRAAFRYPPLLTGLMGTVFFLLVRDRPSDVGLDPYREDDPVSRRAERRFPRALSALAGYRAILVDRTLLRAAHAKGLDNVARYGLLTWMPLYFSQRMGLAFDDTLLLTLGIPLGYLVAPILGGFLSDGWFGSARRPVAMIAAAGSGGILAALVVVPPANPHVVAALVTLGAIAIGMSPLTAVAVDAAGRHLAATAAGIVDAHGYLYTALQAIGFGVLLAAVPNPWPWVFAGMALSRAIATALTWRIRV